MVSDIRYYQYKAIPATAVEKARQDRLFFSEKMFGLPKGLVLTAPLGGGYICRGHW